MTWTNESKSSQNTTYLLQENGDFLLQENNDKIVLSYGAGSWTNETKNLT